jgi:hypothetical protein
VGRVEMRISIKRIAVALLMVLGVSVSHFGMYLVGYDNGEASGRIKPAACPDRSIDGKVLSKITHDHIKNLTTCIYIHKVGISAWQQRT